MRLQQEDRTADAIAMLEAIAATGHRRAAFHVGQLLNESGDPAAAVPWFRRAADAGWATGAYNLGAFHAIGKGVAKDLVESTRWYERAADLGNHEAAIVRGTMWCNGEGSEPDMAQALAWWRRAAREGMPKAMFYLGDSFRAGNGVEKDEVEAIGWYLRAREIEETHITAERIKQLRDAVRARADAGDLVAAARVGQMFVHGCGYARDREEGARWLAKAVEVSADAARELATLHRKGEGAVQDMGAARRLYESAALRGDRDAQHALAFAWSEGHGGPLDADAAIRWYRASADQGALWSLDDLGVCLRDRDPAQSLALSLQAAERGYRRAMLRVGILLRDGRCGPRDPVQALRWLFAALAQRIGDGVHEMHALGKELADDQIHEANRLADDDGSAAETLIATSR